MSPNVSFLTRHIQMSRLENNSDLGENYFSEFNALNVVSVGN